MFDPLQAFLASLIVEGVKAFVRFLKENKLPAPEVDGWLAAFAATVAAFLVAFGDLLAGKLPPTMQNLLSFAIKFVLTLLTMIGVHQLVLKPLKALHVFLAH